MIASGRISWFNPAKKFGFVKLDDHLGDAFLHFNVLKEAGYYFLPRGRLNKHPRSREGRLLRDL